MYESVDMYVYVYSVKRKYTVGAEMPACPKVLWPNPGKEKGKETPA